MKWSMKKFHFRSLSESFFKMAWPIFFQASSSLRSLWIFNCSYRSFSSYILRILSSSSIRLAHSSACIYLCLSSSFYNLLNLACFNSSSRRRYRSSLNLSSSNLLSSANLSSSSLRLSYSSHSLYSLSNRILSISLINLFFASFP